MSSCFIAFYITLRLFSRKNDIKRLNVIYERKQMTLINCGYAKKQCKRGHASSSPSTKHSVTMATDQSQAYCIYS